MPPLQALRAVEQRLAKTTQRELAMVTARPIGVTIDEAAGTWSFTDRDGTVKTYALDAFDTALGNPPGKRVSPLRAIRHMCHACQGGHEYPWLLNTPDGGTEVQESYRPSQAVKDCTSETTCWLWPFRFGTNPYSRRKATAGSFQRRAPGREESPQNAEVAPESSEEASGA